jgi:hypothetical protein
MGRGSFGAGTIGEMQTGGKLADDTYDLDENAVGTAHGRWHFAFSGCSSVQKTIHVFG